MSNNLPVVSKGALRALRNIALGTTSCTIAVTVGILAEERRRRIHTARRALENARKLKGFKQYYSTDTGKTSYTEGSEFNNFDASVLAGSQAGKPPDTYGSLTEEEISNEAEHYASKLSSTTSSHFSESDPFQEYNARGFKRIIGYGFKRIDSTTSLPVPRNKRVSRSQTQLQSVASLSGEQPDSIGFDAPRQPHIDELEADIRAILTTENMQALSTTVEEFLSLFRNAVSERSSAVEDPLRLAALALSKECMRLSRLDLSDKILRAIFSIGPLTENHFLKFHPYDTIGSTWLNLNHPGRGELARAATLFLTLYEECPTFRSGYMFELGKSLCLNACSLSMFDLTDRLLSRLMIARPGVKSLVLLDQLIKNAYIRDDYGRMLHYFHQLFTKTTPDKRLFYRVVSRALSAALSMQTPPHAEMVVVAASKQAELSSLTMPTLWMANILHNTWRYTRDIEQVKDVFYRLEQMADISTRPSLYFAAMMQCCLEAGDRDLALSYYDRYVDRFSPAIPDNRIIGCLALSKAMVHDWAGVTADFESLYSSTPLHEYSRYSSQFFPILVLYAKSHTAKETEEFLRSFIGQYNVPLTTRLLNIVVYSYAREKDMYSVRNLADYAASLGILMDTKSFEILVDALYHLWEFTPRQLYRLYKTIQLQTHGRFDDKELKILWQVVIKKERYMAPKESKKILTELSPPKNDTYNAMAAALELKDSELALQNYERALSESAYIPPAIISLATQASLQHYTTDLTTTIALLRDADARGFDIKPALGSLVIHELSRVAKESEKEPEDLQQTVENTLRLVGKADMKVSMHVVTHAMEVLTRGGHFHKAVGLWSSAKSDDNPLCTTTSVDIVYLTVLFKSYMSLRNAAGIRWILDTLSANKIIPDLVFANAVTQAWRENHPRKQDRWFNQVHTRVNREELFDVLVMLRTYVGQMRSEFSQERFDVFKEVVNIAKRDTVLKSKRVHANGSQKKFAPTVSHKPNTVSWSPATQFPYLKIPSAEEPAAVEGQ